MRNKNEYSENEKNIIKKLWKHGFTDKEISRIVYVFNGHKERIANSIRQLRGRNGWVHKRN